MDKIDIRVGPLTAQFEPGAIIDGRYEIVALIGKGAKGIVYKAKHLTLDEYCAIKVLRPELLSDDKSLSRFTQEAKLSSALEHINIIRTKSFAVTSSGLAYIVMDCLEGQDLLQYLQETPQMPFDLYKNLFSQICEALSYAHSKGIVHRDIKPSNIFIQKDSQGELIAKLIDLGLARTFAGDGEQKLTKTGFLAGTAAYMCPEQCRGETPGPKGDVYSLSAVMYEAFFGRTPFQADSDLLVMQAHVNEKPVFPHSPQAPAGLKEIIERGLAKDPAQRPSASNLKGEISNLNTADLEPKFREKAPRKTAVYMTGALLVILLSCLAGAFLAEKKQLHSDLNNAKSTIETKNLRTKSKLPSESYLQDLKIIKKDSSYTHSEKRVQDAIELAKRARENANPADSDAVLTAGLAYVRAAAKDKNETWVPKAELLSEFRGLESYADKHPELPTPLIFALKKEHGERLLAVDLYKEARSIYESAPRFAELTKEKLYCLKQVVFCSLKLKDYATLDKTVSAILKEEESYDSTIESLAYQAQSYCERKKQEGVKRCLEIMKGKSSKSVDSAVYRNLETLQKMCRVNNYTSEAQEAARQAALSRDFSKSARTAIKEYRPLSGKWSKKVMKMNSFEANNETDGGGGN